MPYTINQAAWATERGEPTIFRAIKSGVISAVWNDDGSYAIDPAELHRIFPPEIRASKSPGLTGVRRMPRLATIIVAPTNEFSA